MANTTLARTQLLFPAVGDTGWGTAFNNAMTTADARIAVLASGSDNVFANKNEFQDTVTIINNIGFFMKDVGGTARQILKMSTLDALTVGNPVGAVEVLSVGTAKSVSLTGDPSGSSDTALAIVGPSGPGSSTRPNLLLTALSSDPGSPADGAFWFNGTALKVRISGVTKTVTVT